MEEIFKGLIERAQYYEQFESYRNIKSEYFRDNTSILKLKAPAANI